MRSVRSAVMSSSRTNPPPPRGVLAPRGGASPTAPRHVSAPDEPRCAAWPRSPTTWRETGAWSSATWIGLDNNARTTRTTTTTTTTTTRARARPAVAGSAAGRERGWAGARRRHPSVSGRSDVRGRASAAGADDVRPNEEPFQLGSATFISQQQSSRDEVDSRRIVLICAVAMLLASADRTIFSLASLAIAQDLNLSMASLGTVQSAFLWGYGVTQILGGMAADRLGGARVLLVGLGLWSLAVALIPVSVASPAPVVMLLATRVLFGAASGCAIPATAATIATYVEASKRSSGLSFVFAFFNCGSAFGLLLAGGLISSLGWQCVFFLFGAAGLMWSVFGYAALPPTAKLVRPSENGVKGTVPAGASKTAIGSAKVGVGAKEKMLVDGDVASARWKSLPSWMYPQLAAMAWCHFCINWGFFILQSWLPAYLAQDLGFSLASSGAASALPWFLTALCSFSSGQIADLLIARGWERWKVRRLMMNVASIGPVITLILLPAARSTAAAVGLLAVMLGTQAVSIAGYHAYVQDVAPSRAGAFLGITNTLGVFAGIMANVMTGHIVQTTGGFALVFIVTAGMYASSGIVWNCFLRGKMLFP